MNDCEQFNTAEINEKDKAHFLHPWQIFDSFKQEGALAIAEGDGCYITDTDGKKYFDAVGGLWCNNIGMGRREMADAIAEQALKMSYASPFVDMSNVPAVELATEEGVRNFVFVRFSMSEGGHYDTQTQRAIDCRRAA